MVFSIVRGSLVVMGVAFLLTPWSVAGHDGAYAPAFVVAVFDTFFRQDGGDPMAAIIAMGIVFLVGMTLFLGLLAFWRTTGRY